MIDLKIPRKKYLISPIIFFPSLIFMYIGVFLLGFEIMFQKEKNIHYDLFHPMLQIQDADDSRHYDLNCFENTQEFNGITLQKCMPFLKKKMFIELLKQIEPKYGSKGCNNSIQKFQLADVIQSGMLSKLTVFQVTSRLPIAVRSSVSSSSKPIRHIKPGSILAGFIVS